MSVDLRTALPADRESVIDLIQSLNAAEADLTGDRKRDRGAAAAYHDELLDRLARQEGRLVLAEAEGVVGLMGFCLETDAPYVVDSLRRHGTVTDLVVREAWRGRGIGQALLAEAERLTRAAGLKRLTIGVLAANAGAERLYRRSGFAPYVSILVKAV